MAEVWQQYGSGVNLSPPIGFGATSLLVVSR
jgi:hypothetical protein